MTQPKSPKDPAQICQKLLKPSLTMPVPALALMFTSGSYNLARSSIISSTRPTTIPRSYMCWKVLQPSLAWPAPQSWLSLVGIVTSPYWPALITSLISGCYSLAQPRPLPKPSFHVTQ